MLANRGGRGLENTAEGPFLEEKGHGRLASLSQRAAMWEPCMAMGTQRTEVTGLSARNSTQRKAF